MTQLSLRRYIVGCFTISIFSASLTAQISSSVDRSRPALVGHTDQATHTPRKQPSPHHQTSLVTSGLSSAEATAIPQAQNSSEVVLHAFANRHPQGVDPESGLVLDSAGNAYGATYAGGPENALGYIFKRDPSGNITPVYGFPGGTSGGNPTGDLTLDAAGNLYGVTSSGGNSTTGICYFYGGCGVVFKVDRSGNETVLYTFNGGADGAFPHGGLLLDNAGNLYGTAENGGNLTGVCANANGCGVVFKLDPSGKETVLYTFTGGVDGAYPNENLVRDNAGNLYGTTSNGGNLNGVCAGNSGCGVVFKLDKLGNEKVLYTFSGAADGATPLSGLTVDEDGNVYGATSAGGDLNVCAGSGCGVVFKLNKSLHQKVLYTFEDGADGAAPQVSLALDSAGNLYGTTPQGGDLTACSGNGCGVIFKLDPSGNETVLHTFTAGTDGAIPHSGVTLDKAGDLYGTTSSGGSLARFGTIYKLGLDRNSTEYSLYALPSSADGSFANGGVVLDAAGNLYGTTSLGGPYDRGIAFKLDKSGHETVLHVFTGGADGGVPEAGLILDKAGNLYGVASEGGNLTGNCAPYGCGLIFKLDPSGKETVLYTFTGGADGNYPIGRLTLDAAGNIYGTTDEGGNLTGNCPGFGCGVVFKLDPSGHQTVLYTFNFGTDGAFPQGNVILDKAGNLYGTAKAASLGCGGVVFKLDPSGTETPLYTFTCGADGGAPDSSLAMDSAGNLYSTAEIGGDLTGACGSQGCGVVFKVDPSGHETVLHAFTGGADGASPDGGVILDSAGNVYATAAASGNLTGACASNGGCGVVFKLDPSGNETVLYTFTGGNDGSTPGREQLSLDSAGNLYGSAIFDGPDYGGAIFKIRQH